MSDPGGYITEDTYRKILNETDNNRDRLIIRILWETGIRTSELLDIKFVDCFFDKKTIFVKTLKGKPRKDKETGELIPPKKRRRNVPISSVTIELIKDYKISSQPKPRGHGIFDEYPGLNRFKWHDGDRLFPLGRTTIFNIVKGLCKKANVTTAGGEPVHTHHFRHGFAINWIENGGDIRRLQVILGHSSVATTEGYLKFTIDDIVEEHERIFGR